jgi:short-subunit dehydrogenase
MKKTILITGTSSGIGKSTAIEFAKKGWNVIATQRNPEKETDFKTFNNVKLYPLDVTNLDSITQVFKKVKEEFGTIDVVLNNAGYGVDGAFEAMSDEVIEKQFNTNVFGLMRVTREAIKAMRPSGGGTIIQISSMGGKITFPLYSIYHSTKFAVEGFTESLHYELAQ